MSSESRVTSFLKGAEVDLNTFEAQPSFYKKFDHLFTLGWGDDYIKGTFKIKDEDLITMFSKIYKAFGLYLQGKDVGFQNLRFHYGYHILNATQIFNWQFIRPKKFADIHYELPHQLFVNMLGETRAYSSGYWPEGINTLDEAQNAKFELIVRKLGLKAGDTVLEFGCGAGSFGRYAGALGIKVVGLNICQEQLAYARKHNDQEVPAIYLDFNLVTQSVDELRDILKVHGIQEFDSVIFVGSIEHVGWKNYTSLYRKLYQLLKQDGEILCHTIGSYLRIPCLDPYITKYIFPDGQLPTVEAMTKSTEAAGFQLMDWHNLETGIHSYAKTLRCWLHNFQQNWHKISPFMPNKDKEAFYREWVFYLMLCIGGFESNNFINVGHYVFRKIGDNRPFTVVR